MSRRALEHQLALQAKREQERLAMGIAPQRPPSEVRAFLSCLPPFFGVCSPPSFSLSSKATPGPLTTRRVSRVCR
jgi:hypothetical protein